MHYNEYKHFPTILRISYCIVYAIRQISYVHDNLLKFHFIINHITLKLTIRLQIIHPRISVTIFTRLVFIAQTQLQLIISTVVRVVTRRRRHSQFCIGIFQVSQGDLYLIFNSLPNDYFSQQRYLNMRTETLEPY